MQSNKMKFMFFLMFFLSIGIIGCRHKTAINQKSEINLSQLLEYQNSYAGDHIAVGHMINNLPANAYHNGFALQTTTEPYELTINYEIFEVCEVNLEDGNLIEDPLSKVLIKNALILFALIQNVEVIHFNIESYFLATYNREDLVTAYEEAHGVNYQTIISNPSNLKAFLESNFY